MRRGCDVEMFQTSRTNSHRSCGDDVSCDDEVEHLNTGEVGELATGFGAFVANCAMDVGSVS